MRNFSSKTRENSRRNFKRGSLVRVVAVFLIAIVALFVFKGLIGGVMSFVTTPLYGIKGWFAESSATVPSYFRDREVLINRIHGLEREIATLHGRNTNFEKLSDENERLRVLLGAETSTRIGAGVIARPPHVPYDALLIDRGTRNGVRDGAIVYHGEYQAIGFIAKAYETSALVSLFTTPGVESTVYVLGSDIYTKAYGEGGGVIRVSVPQGVPLATGDMVVLPSIESGLLGSIQTVESVATKPEQNGFVTFATPIQSMQFVSVGTAIPEKVDFEKAEEIVQNARTSFLEVDVPEGIIIDTSASSTTTEVNASSTEDGVTAN